MYTPPPKPDQSLGLTSADFVVPDTEVWPDNWPAVEALFMMRTQWRVGFAGPTGLDYAALPPEASYGTELFDDLRVMEDEALKALGELRG